MELAHTKSADECLRHFGVDPEKGYSESDVKRAQDKYGPNGNYLSILFIL